MEKLYLGDDGRHSLVILFLGWGFNPESFAGLRKPGSSILLLAGYEGLAGPEIDAEIKEFISERGLVFSEVVVIAWSFGVKAAAMFLETTDLPVTLSLAVNGTEYHIDNRRGILPEIFNGTLDGLSEKTLAKFRLRCAGSRANLGKLDEGELERNTDIDTLRKELEWFAALPAEPSPRRHSIWDKVVAGEEDRIFPFANQLEAWQGYDVFAIPGMNHLPDFRWLIDTFVVDKAKVVRKFTTASRTYTDNAVAQRETANNLYDRFVMVFNKSEMKERLAGAKLSVLELGYGDGTFTRTYLGEMLPVCYKVTLADINAPGDCGWIQELATGAGGDCVEFIQADAEAEEFQQMAMGHESRDIIFSSSMFQWLNSPRRMLKRCADALRPGGIIALSFYGPGTLKEIAETVGSGLKYPSPEWMGKIAGECDLHIESLESEENVILFDTPADALRHLRLTGVNALPEAPSPAKARHMLNNWPLTTDGKASLTFHPVYMVLSKRDKHISSRATS